MCPRWMSKKQVHPGSSNMKAFAIAVAKVTIGKLYVIHYEGASMSHGTELIPEARADIS